MKSLYILSFTIKSFIVSLLISPSDAYRQNGPTLMDQEYYFYRIQAVTAPIGRFGLNSDCDVVTLKKSVKALLMIRSTLIMSLIHKSIYFNCSK